MGAQRNKQLLLQTSGLSIRRGSFGPPSAGTPSGPTTMSSLPSTPQSAANSLPGSPLVAAANDKQKAGRAPIPTPMNLASIRKKRGTGSSSSLSTSFAMPQLPVFTPPISPQSPDVTAGGTQQSMQSLNFGSIPTTPTFGDHRASITSSSSGGADIYQDSRTSQGSPNDNYMRSSNGAFFGTPPSAIGSNSVMSPTTQVTDHMALWNMDSSSNNSAFDTPFLDSLQQQQPQPGNPSSFHASTPFLPIHHLTSDLQLSSYPPIHGQGAGSRQYHGDPPPANVSEHLSASHPVSPSKSHAIPPSLHMSPFQPNGVGVGIGTVPPSTHNTDSTMMMMNIMNHYRRTSAASPSGFSDMIADDVLPGVSSPDLGMSHGVVASPPMSHSRHPSGHGSITSPKMTPAAAMESAANRSAHIQRMEMLTRRMMAIGLNRVEAELAAERATASVSERGAAVVVDEEKMDMGQCNALRDMVAKGKVSMNDAIARVAAATIGSGAAGTSRSSPGIDPFAGALSVGTPLGTVKEEQEPDLFRSLTGGGEDTRGRTQEKKTKPTKVIGFGGAGEDDPEEFAS